MEMKITPKHTAWRIKFWLPTDGGLVYEDKCWIQNSSSQPTCGSNSGKLSCRQGSGIRTTLLQIRIYFNKGFIKHYSAVVRV